MATTKPMEDVASRLKRVATLFDLIAGEMFNGGTVKNYALLGQTFAEAAEHHRAIAGLVTETPSE